MTSQKEVTTSRALHADATETPVRQPSVVEDINGSLRAIDEDASKHQKKPKKHRKKRGKLKTVILVIGLLLLAALGVLFYRAWAAGGKMFGGNLLGIFQQQELKME
jgi:hypothetical protein